MARSIGLVMMVWATACGGDASLSAADEAAIEDGLATIDVDRTIVDQVEVTLSGTVDPADTTADAATKSAAAARSRLSPSSCLTSTVQANVVMHVLTGCVGPRGRMLAGTIVSTWTRDGQCLHVQHATTNFTIGGRAATGSLGVKICGTGTTETRTRDLTFDATTQGGKAVSLTGHWDVSRDLVSGCATQSGPVDGQIGDKLIDRADADFLWCPTQARTAFVDGTETLEELVGGSTKLTWGASEIDLKEFRITFLGDGRIQIADQNGDLTYDNIRFGM